MPHLRDLKQDFFTIWSYSFYGMFEGVRAFRGYFGPLSSQKLKVAYNQFHLIDLLEE